MRRIAVALTVALSAVAAAPAAEGKVVGPRQQSYRVTTGEGEIRVAFRGDQAAGCRERGVCGVSGTSTHAFGGKPDHGEVFWLRARKRTLVFAGFFETLGTTTSDVGTAGSSERCVDRATGERYESMSFEPRSQRVRFNWRKLTEDGEEEEGFIIGFGRDTDPFDTRCAGPALEDMAGALPVADVPYRVFRSPKSSFRTTGARPFAGGGFAGTVEWDLRYGLQFRSRRR
jgi:hypothetical protein